VGVIETLDRVESLVEAAFRFGRLLIAVALVAGGIGLAVYGYDEEQWGIVAGGGGAVVGGIALWIVTQGEYRAFRLARRGTQVQASLIGIRDTGMRNGDEHVEGEPFWSMSFDLGGGRRARCTQDVHPACRSVMRPGGPVVLRVSPRGRRVMLDCPATLAWHGAGLDPRWVPDRVHRPWRDVAPGRKERARFSIVGLVLGIVFLLVGAGLCVAASGQSGEARTGLLITGGTFVMIAVIWLVVIAAIKVFGRVPADALPARSQVLDARLTGTTINDRRVVKMQLRSQLQDGRSFDHEARVAVPSIVIDRVVPGTWIVGHISPSKPSKVRVDWPQTTAWLDSGR
jgi:hypothetical protein